MTTKRSVFLFTGLAVVMSMGSAGGQALARYAVPPAPLEVPVMDEFKVVPIPHLGRNGMMAASSDSFPVANRYQSRAPLLPREPEPREAFSGAAEPGFALPVPGKTARKNRFTQDPRPEAEATGKRPPSAEAALRGPVQPPDASGKVQSPGPATSKQRRLETESPTPRPFPTADRNQGFRPEPDEPRELQVRTYAIPPTGNATTAAGPAPFQTGRRPPTTSPVPAHLPPGQPQKPAAFAMVNRDNARLRDAPSLDGERLAVLQKGDIGRVLERRDGWSRLHLRARGTTGWVRDDLLAIP